MNVKNPYIPVKAEITNIIEETPNIKTFVLKPENPFSFRTGQFVEITVPGLGEAPFTPSSSPYKTDITEVTIMEVGQVTTRMHNMKAGEALGLRGPFGLGYPLNKMYGKELLILGGGVGMAPLRSFLLSVLEEIGKFKRVILCYGARSPQDIVYKKQFPAWIRDPKLEVYRSVDKADSSWKETEGVVTVLLDKFEVDLQNCVAVVCGPPIMMKFGTQKLLSLGHKPENIYLSMEKNMSCGIGKCGHCSLGKYYVCKDGPVFSYDMIENINGIWD